MLKKLKLVEFSAVVLWTLVMIGLSIYSVMKGKEISLGLATAYTGCVAAFAIKQTWGEEDVKEKRR